MLGVTAAVLSSYAVVRQWQGPPLSIREALRYQVGPSSSPCRGMVEAYAENIQLGFDFDTSALFPEQEA